MKGFQSKTYGRWIHLPMQGTWIQSLSGKIPHAGMGSWAQEPQLLSPYSQAHGPQEKPLQWEARTLQQRVATRESPCAAKNKKKLIRQENLNWRFHTCTLRRMDLSWETNFLEIRDLLKADLPPDRWTSTTNLLPSLSQWAYSLLNFLCGLPTLHVPSPQI